MTTSTHNMSDGSILIITHEDGGYTEETRKDTGDGYVTVTIKHLDGRITEERLLPHRL